MKSFYTGDRVRLLHSHGQGIVQGRDAKGNVRVLLEDGFEIPVLDKDLALVHEQERKAMARPAEDEAASRKGAAIRPAQKPQPGQKPAGIQAANQAGPISRKGLYLALTAPLAGSLDRELFLLNNTHLHWAGTLGIRLMGTFRTEAVFVAQPKQATRVAALNGNLLKQNPLAEFWGVAALLGSSEKPETLHTTWQMTQEVQARPAGDAPLLSRPCVFHQIDLKQPETPKVDPATLVKKWTAAAPENRPALAAPPREVDLHIEKLSPMAASLSSSDEILRIQIKAFTQALDAASATGAPELVLIHGVGNGTLRNAIQKHLSQRQDIEFYKDHMKERLGHGATYIKFREG